MEVCRACLSRSGGARCLFGGRRRAAAMLAACCAQHVAEGDGFPAHLCRRCYRQLCQAYSFRLLCQASYATLLATGAPAFKQEDIKYETDDDSPILHLKQSYDSNTVTAESIAAPLEVDIPIKSENINDNMYDNEETFSPIVEISLDKFSEEDKHVKTKLKGVKKKLSERAKRKLNMISSNMEKPFICSFCPKRFKLKRLLLAHQDCHYGIKRYYCNICQKDYRNEKDHTNMHRRGFKFHCEQCSKNFNTKNKLEVHKKTHNTDRERLICDIEGCDKSFITVNGLNRHKLSHTGSKDFICQMCSKSFLDKYRLEIHVRIHTNDRRHSCGYCNKKFITVSKRNAHERSHTNTKNYPCEYCEKRFLSLAALKRHILCHTKEQPLSCRFCDKKFARCDNKKRHEIAMHQFAEYSTVTGLDKMSN